MQRGRLGFAGFSGRMKLPLFQFTYTAAFGAKMIGRAQRWPEVDFSAPAEVNPDVAGWIRMPGTPIDYPVAASREDESYYLSHNFSGEESLHGAAFEAANAMFAEADVRCSRPCVPSRPRRPGRPRA